MTKKERQKKWNKKKKNTHTQKNKTKTQLYYDLYDIVNVIYLFITKTRLFKYIENFTTKNWKFSDKNSDSFHISA